MRVQIVPDPPPDEREALLEALGGPDAVAGQPAAYRSAWRRAAFGGGSPDDYWTTAPRLKSAGAARA